jgi:hypothetical protein
LFADTMTAELGPLAISGWAEAPWTGWSLTGWAEALKVGVYVAIVANP